MFIKHSRYWHKNLKFYSGYVNMFLASYTIVEKTKIVNS